jgi:glycerol uptake facilitator protein
VDAPSFGDAFVAELLGTMLLIILGDGVVGNVLLARSKAFDAGWMVVSTGWGIAVAVAVYAVGGISGAHINPAVTLSFATIGELPWSYVPVYIAGQMVGAIIGAVVVWIHYYGHWRLTEDPEAKLAVFATGPAIRSALPNFLSEVIGTFVLVFGILAIVNAFQSGVSPEDLRTAFQTGVQPLLIGVLVLGIGASLGGPTGYAINPARDLGPRIAHAILPIAGKGGSDWGYAWIPVLGPIVGGLLGALLFQVTLAS